ncbi:MAG: hypothetical protein QOF14_5749 [Hyphomicrobiales bacterium]|jgi:hypothetical protein|nr:hypothetical protein [Hyphomicrobiales bacterium]
MPNITYYVVLAFVRNEEGEGELIAEAPAQMPSATAATSRARSLASTRAGVIAFARTGDPDIGEFADAVLLFKAGEVPDNVFDVE